MPPNNQSSTSPVIKTIEALPSIRKSSTVVLPYFPEHVISTLLKKEHERELSQQCVEHAAAMRYCDLTMILPFKLSRRLLIVWCFVAFTQSGIGGRLIQMEARTKDDEVTIEENEDGSFVDPLCAPGKAHKITFADITSASFKVRNGITCTPCVRSHLSSLTGVDIYFKKDFLQYTGSFKERGACYALRMLTDEQKKKGVISASLGNHALALCYHGKLLQVPVTVVMPVVAPIMKIQSCKSHGANVVIKGKNMKEAKHIAMRLAKENGYTYINGYDHPHIIAGQGTLGLEVVEQIKDIDAIVVPVGGGGLIAGVALAAKTLQPSIKIIGVESDRCPSFSKALKAGSPTEVPIHSTLADGLAVPLVGYNAFATAAPLIDKMVVVNEEWIAIAILRLVEHEKCVVEGAGASGLAAILAGHLDELKGKRVVIPLCGGNIDTTILGRCLERGLAVDGRLLKFCVTVSDRPGGIADLCQLVSETRVSIKDIMHERAWITSDVFSVQVTVVCETMDKEHAAKLKKILTENYKTVVFGDFMNPWTMESHD